jgi:hypothetical protein
LQTQTLTKEIIEALKAKHGDIPLYKTNLADIDFVFSYIPRDEYKHIAEWLSSNGTKITEDMYDDKLIDYALLWPTVGPLDWMTLPAGVTRSLSRSIQEKSYLKTNMNGDFDELEIEDLSEAKPGNLLIDKEKEKIKKANPGQLRAITIDGSTYVVRPMNRLVYKGLQKLPEDQDGEVEGVKKCLVWPENVNFDKTSAGVATILATEIMNISGFSEPVVEVL